MKMQCLNKIVFLLILATFAKATEVEQCDNIAKPLFVAIEGCTKPPCQLALGTSAIMNITFHVPHYSSKITPKTTAILNGIPIPYPLRGGGCISLLNGYCPIVKDEILVYHFELPIDGFPKIAVIVRFRLEDDKNKAITCFKVPIEVV